MGVFLLRGKGDGGWGDGGDEMMGRGGRMDGGRSGGDWGERRGYQGQLTMTKQPVALVPTRCRDRDPGMLTHRLPWRVRCIGPVGERQATK